MRRILISIIRCYQLVVSPLLGARCRFYPSCSNYAIGALKNHGARRGAALAAKRMVRCHPWHPGGIDPVPKAEARRHG